MRCDTNRRANEPIKKPDPKMTQDRCKYQGEENQKHDVMKISMMDSKVKGDPEQAMEYLLSDLQYQVNIRYKCNCNDNP